MLLKDAGILKDQIRLVYQGVPLTDEVTVRAKNIQPSETIHMILQL